MKKILAIILIILFSTSVFAKAKKVTRRSYKTEEIKTDYYGSKKDADQDIYFSFEFYGLVYGLRGVQGDYIYDASHIRLRPGFTLANSDMKAVFRLEIDQNFGRGIGNQDADPGTDNYAVEIKHAYLETSESMLNGLVLMAGLNSYSFPVVVDNDFALIQASYNFGLVKPVLSLLTIDEYSEVEQTAAGVEQDTDCRAYAADIPIIYRGFGIRTGVMHIVGGGGSPTFSEGRVTNIAVNVTGDVGFALLDASGAYMTGDLNSTTETNSYSFDAELAIKPAKGIRLGGFITFGSGDDGSDASEYNSYFYIMNNLLGSTTSKSGAPDGRLLLFENATVANSLTGMPASVFDYMDDPLGYMSYGGYAEAEIGNFTALAQFGMAFLVEEDANGKNAIGSEIDLKVSYGIAPSTSVFAEGAYIIAADVIEDNAYQAAFGMTTEF